jgi:hypothetical protein
MLFGSKCKSFLTTRILKFLSTFVGKKRATVWLTGGGENEILDQPFPEPFTRPKRLALIANI